MTVYSEKAREFLIRHGMDAERIDPDACIGAMKAQMLSGLAGGPCSMEMIPTYLSNDGALPRDACAAVIDAGGTNFRRALVRFTVDGPVVSNMHKCSMPGVGESCSWEEFIRFTADQIEPLMAWTDVIGFCFSYPADITPERDGRVVCIDKEVVVQGCEGQLVGGSLLEELERRGITGKRIVILNDTVAVLLGGAANLDKDAYSGFIGQVSGTGTNTCASLPVKQIGKLGLEGEGGMVVNLESGSYDGIRGGDFDRMLDASSHAPGTKLFEKLTAGVYLGSLARLMLQGAVEEDLLSDDCAAHVRSLPRIDASVIDAWAAGEGFSLLGGDEDDHAFAQELSMALFRRSARCMCTNLLAIAELADGGKDKPMCVLAEGSLVQKGRHYRPELQRLLEEYGYKGRGRRLELHVGEETTIPGAAAAALLNA